MLFGVGQITYGCHGNQVSGLTLKGQGKLNND
jgi:hypothetical protein